LDRRLGGPQSRSGCGGEEKNSQPLPGLELPIIQPVALHYTTELSRLNIRMDLREVGWEIVDWIHLSQDRDQWWTLVNTCEHSNATMGFIKSGNFFFTK
jgi:hypothetical protein